MIPIGGLAKGTWNVDVAWPGDANYDATTATGKAVTITK